MSFDMSAGNQLSKQIRQQCFFWLWIIQFQLIFKVVFTFMIFFGRIEVQLISRACTTNCTLLNRPYTDRKNTKLCKLSHSLSCHSQQQEKQTRLDLYFTIHKQISRLHRLETDCDLQQKSVAFSAHHRYRAHLVQFWRLFLRFISFSLTAKTLLTGARSDGQTTRWPARGRQNKHLYSPRQKINKTRNSSSKRTAQRHFNYDSPGNHQISGGIAMWQLLGGGQMSVPRYIIHST